ncbi:MAG TPA: DUF5985 family protein [Thermoanaerobaculia bacterium]|jgi:hypothetical protein
MFGNIVYILCAATSTLCAILLLRGYRQSKAHLLLWSAVCFIGLALNNVLLVVDLRTGDAVDLSIWRIIPAVIGAGALLYALVWETR